MIQHHLPVIPFDRSDDLHNLEYADSSEDIALHTIEMYRQAGGENLVHCIMRKKRSRGTTLFTVVHQRET